MLICEEKPAVAWLESPSGSESDDMSNRWRLESEPSEAEPNRSQEAFEDWKAAVLAVLAEISNNPRRYLQPEWSVVGKAVEGLRALELIRRGTAWLTPDAIQAHPGRAKRYVRIVKRDDEGSRFQSQLDQIYQLSLAGKVHGAGDAIFDLVQGLLRTENFSACDRLLAMVDVARLEPALMITFLATTFTARDRLRAREAYFSRVLARLIEQRGEDRATRLLDKYR